MLVATFIMLVTAWAAKGNTTSIAPRSYSWQRLHSYPARAAAGFLLAWNQGQTENVFPELPVPCLRDVPNLDTRYLGI